MILKQKKMATQEMRSVAGGRLRSRVVMTQDTDGDGKWDVKIVQVFVNGAMVRSRTRFR